MSAPSFACDAMLGGLARWLRAVGYAAWFDPRIDDAVLVAQAEARGDVLLSSDRPLFERRALRSGLVRGLFVPRHAPIDDQAAFVLRSLGLSVREPRCMACGGDLLPAEKSSLAREVPPGALAAFEAFYRCGGCGRVFWHGSHWARIAARREAIARRLT